MDDDQLRNVVRQRLDSLRWFGIHELPRPTGKYQFPRRAASESQETRSKAADAVASQSTPSQPTPQQKVANANLVRESQTGKPRQSLIDLTQNYGPALGKSDRIGQLQILRDEVAECTKCDLSKTRTQTVFGVGNPMARLAFLGEGPGADEDRQGEPFVGAAGQLLDKIIAAMKLSRSDVYILNTVKCRPPGNRNPAESELDQCWSFAVRQLEILQPEVICCLGSVAARTLLQSSQSIGRMRGRFYQYRSSRVAVTYHPAYLLRTPTAKKLVWEDMKMILSELDN